MGFTVRGVIAGIFRDVVMVFEQPFLRASTHVRSSKDIVPDQAERILISIAKAVEASANLLRGPEARITDISAAGIEFEVRFWTPDWLARGDVRMETQKNILRKIRLAGHHLPYSPRRFGWGKSRQIDLR